MAMLYNGRPIADRIENLANGPAMRNDSENTTS